MQITFHCQVKASSYHSAASTPWQSFFPVGIHLEFLACVAVTVCSIPYSPQPLHVLHMLVHAAHHTSVVFIHNIHFK